MSVQPFYTPKFRAFDANGDPLAGGLLYSYSAGTTTPLATYTTRAGTVANANPVVLDANGEANVWTTPGADYKFELRNSAGVVQWTVDNVPSPSDVSSDSMADPGGILTLTSSGTPLTAADVTGATTLYYVSHKSDTVPLWDGNEWVLSSFGTGLSQATTDTTKSPAAVAVSSNYDVFIWDDNGTVRMSRGPAWTSGTARGTGVGTTELERLDGRWVNKNSISNGPAARRGLYVGTVRSDGSSQLNDTLTSRHLWNLYGDEARPAFASETGLPVIGKSTAVQGRAVQGISTTDTGVHGEGTAYGGFFQNNSTGPAIGVGTGHAKLTGSNPASSTAFTNTLTPANVPKAWGVVASDGAGGHTVVDGFNIASASSGGNFLQVTLAQAMANATYAVVCGFDGSANYFAYRTSSATKTTTTFRIEAWDINVASVINFNTTAHRLEIVVFGRQ